MTISKSSAVHEIERIVDHRDKSPHLDSKTGRMIRDREYLIKWKKYDHSYNTWEPYNTIKQDAPDSVHLYEETQKSKRIENKRKLLKQQKEEALAKKKKQEQENLKEAKNVLKDDITLKPILDEEETKIVNSQLHKVAPLKLKLQGNKLNPKIMENIDGTAQITSPRIASKIDGGGLSPRETSEETTTTEHNDSNSSSNSNSKSTSDSDYDTMETEKPPEKLISPSSIKTTINLKKFRNQNNSSRFEETRLVHEISNLTDFRIFKIEPPNGQEPDQLIYRKHKKVD